MVHRVLVYAQSNTKKKTMITTIAALVLSQSAPWTPLLVGNSLAGWHQLGGKAKYSVEGDEIVGRTVKGTPNSFLCTDKAYGDFELQYDVKVDPKLNSGVQVRSNSVGGYKNGQVHGYQIEIDPSDRAWSGGLYDEGRRLWLQDVSKNPAGQKAFKNNGWNHFRVRAVGDHFQTWLNGVAVTDYRDDLSSFGFIGLQVHNFANDGAEVRFKNLMIKDYGIPGATPPRGGTWLLHSKADIANWVTENRSAGQVEWKWAEDYLEIVPGKSDIITKDKYTDFQLHV